MNHIRFNKHQVTDGSPYYVPNGGIAFVISQIFGSVIFEIYFYLAYKSLRSPQFLQHVHHHCLLAIGNAPGLALFPISGSSSLSFGFRKERARELAYSQCCSSYQFLRILVLWFRGFVHLVSSHIKMPREESMFSLLYWQRPHQS